MSADGSLIPIESINAVEVFKGKNLDQLLERIREETATIVPDVATVAGRKEIASLAYKVARSKTTIDDAGKQLVAGWKQQAAEVDAARKHARDYLDSLKEEIRAPLTEYENEQKRIEQEAIERAQREREAEERRQREEIARKEAELRAREEAIAKAEEAARVKAAAEQAERDRKERDEQLRKEAEEKAKRDASEAIARAEAEAAQAKEAARLAAEHAEREKAQAAERAEREKQEAIARVELKAKQEAEEKERARIADAIVRAAEAAQIKDEEDRRAADREHRKDVNNKALAAFVDEGIAEEVARQVITAIASGNIPAISIRY